MNTNTIKVKAGSLKVGDRLATGGTIVDVRTKGLHLKAGKVGLSITTKDGGGVYHPEWNKATEVAIFEREEKNY